MHSPASSKPVLYVPHSVFCSGSVLKLLHSAVSSKPILNLLSSAVSSRPILSLPHSEITSTSVVNLLHSAVSSRPVLDELHSAVSSRPVLNLLHSAVCSRPVFGLLHLLNSIAFGSAPRREADRHPISQLARPAVSQTETHSLGVLSVADSAPSSGENQCPQGKLWPNGNAADRRLFGRRFESRSGEHGWVARPTTVDRPGFEPPT